MSDKLSLPEKFDQTLEFYTSGGVLGSVNVKAASSSFGANGIELRDKSTDVAFTINYEDVPELQEWAGIAGQFRVKWLETNNENRYWVYAIQKIGKQAVLLCSLAGSSSLTPPPSTEDFATYGGITQHDWPHRVPKGGTKFLGTNAYLPPVYKNFLGHAQIGGLDFLYFEANSPASEGRIYPSSESRTDLVHEVCYLRIPKGVKDVVYDGNPWAETFDFETDLTATGDETPYPLQAPFFNAIHPHLIFPSQGEKALTRRTLTRPVPFLYQDGDIVLIKLFYHQAGFTFPGGGPTVYHWMMPFRGAGEDGVIIDDVVASRTAVVSGGTTGIVIVDDIMGYMPTIFNTIASCANDEKWYLNLNGPLRYITSNTETEELGFFAIKSSDCEILIIDDVVAS